MSLTSVEFTPKKQFSPDIDAAGHDHVRRDEQLSRMREWWPMWLPLQRTTLSPTRHERLDDVVLEDEAVLAELDVAPHERLPST